MRVDPPRDESDNAEQQKQDHNRAGCSFAPGYGKQMLCCQHQHPPCNGGGEGNQPQASTSHWLDEDGGIDWRPLKWARSGSPPQTATPLSPTSRKKPRLGWGEGLAKYENKKKRVQTPFDDASASSSKTSPAFPGFASPEENPDRFQFNPGALNLDDLNSGLLELQKAGDGPADRWEIMKKLGFWKTDILRSLEATETEIDLLEGELREEEDLRAPVLCEEDPVVPPIPSPVTRRFMRRKRSVKTKEILLALKFRALTRLWKEDVRLLSIRDGKHALPSPGGDSSSSGKIGSIDMNMRPYRETLNMPAMVLEKKGRFDSRNGLVSDPRSVEMERKLTNPWTFEEKEVFIERLTSLGKNFRRISAFLDHKTTADCVEFYYKNHKDASFPKPAKRRGKSSSRARLLPPQNTRSVVTPLDILSEVSELASHVRAGSKRVVCASVGSCVTSSVDRCKCGGKNLRCSDGAAFPDWTDHEKTLFVRAVSTHGKDFQTVSRCVGTRSRVQCRIFFSKARRCLGLDSVPPGTASHQHRETHSVMGSNRRRSKHARNDGGESPVPVELRYTVDTASVSSDSDLQLVVRGQAHDQQLRRSKSNRILTLKVSDPNRRRKLQAQLQRVEGSTAVLHKCCAAKDRRRNDESCCVGLCSKSEQDDRETDEDEELKEEEEVVVELKEEEGVEDQMEMTAGIGCSRPRILGIKKDRRSTDVNGMQESLQGK